MKVYSIDHTTGMFFKDLDFDNKSKSLNYIGLSNIITPIYPKYTFNASNNRHTPDNNNEFKITFTTMLHIKRLFGDSLVEFNKTYCVTECYDIDMIQLIDKFNNDCNYMIKNIDTSKLLK